MNALPVLFFTAAIGATVSVPSTLTIVVEPESKHVVAESAIEVDCDDSSITPEVVVAPEPAAPIALLGGVGSVETYCDATPNTFGTIARIDCMGSFDVRAKSFGLRVIGAPPMATSFGMFTCGQVQTNVPFGNGYLCISPFTPGILRMRMQSLAVGPVSKTMEDSADEFAMCEPGSAWNFQFWYRNPAAGAITFNTSDAIHVQFAP